MFNLNLFPNLYTCLIYEAFRVINHLLLQLLLVTSLFVIRPRIFLISEIAVIIDIEIGRLRSGPASNFFTTLFATFSKSIKTAEKCVSSQNNQFPFYASLVQFGCCAIEFEFYLP